MQITAFEKRLDEESAIERTRNLSTKAYVYGWLADRLGWETETGEFDVTVVYYPDYIAYTTATISQTLRGDKTLQFLAAVDAVTGRAGEVDVELPTQRSIETDPELVIDPQVDPADAESTWREWLFEYVGRYHRATAMPDHSLDDLELVYTPYWVIDYGTVAESLAVSDLTGRTAKVEEIEVVEAFYRRQL